MSAADGPLNRTKNQNQTDVLIFSTAVLPCWGRVSLNHETSGRISEYWREEIQANR
jgi:hypothetical protein